MIKNKCISGETNTDNGFSNFSLISGLVWFGLVWLVGFHGIPTFVGYSMPNPFLYK